MTAYQIDLGFDWNAILKEGSSTYLLQWGPVLEDGTPVLGTLAQVQRGDTLTFNIYDLTPTDGGTFAPGGTVPNIDSAWMTWNPVDTNAPKGNPFSNWNDIVNATIGTRAIGSSPIWQQPPFSFWPIVLSGGQTPLTADVQPATSSNPADYALSWALTVTLPGSPDKVFAVDPEMIVKP